jgi:NAD(P)-dependent dehydrogenase (short-subunit alcohol dehydrogenase family)
MLTPEERDACLNVLQKVAENPMLIANDDRFKGLVAKIYTKGKKESLQRLYATQMAEDRALVESTGMVQVQKGVAQAPALPSQSPVTVQTPSPSGEASTPTRKLNRPERCYVCKEEYVEMHAFYHCLCPACAATNWQMRHARADLTGRVALLTGGRVKIGYHVALKLLRDGATVMLTTRFPADAERRFVQEADYDEWSSRLTLYGLDLRNLPAVEAFATHLNDTLPSLDILINNAAQTIKRPLEFYSHLLSGEAQHFLLEAHSKYGGHLPGIEPAYFPENAIDSDGQAIDYRPENSWVQKLGEVSTVEALEVHLVNSVAPFMLCGQLRPLFLCSPFERRFIVNVSAMEGQFGRNNKTPNHPHTNMAKAALNMLTRTSAKEYAEHGIYMNSADTGWITDENPYDKREHIRETTGFFAPLDIVDGASRIYHPVVQGINEEVPLYGHFLKDYAPYRW